EALSSLKEKHLSIISSIIPTDFRKSAGESIGNLFEELALSVQSVYHLRELSLSVCDRIVSFGELFSTAILVEKFRSSGVQCKWIDTRQIIRTAWKRGKNTVDMETTIHNVQAALKEKTTRLYIAPGFIAANESGATTTLGRGGSDYTAAIIASAIEARILEIWTDVDGMMTADPRIVPDARTISHISYKEALELSHFGAKVIFPSTIQPAVRSNIPILVKNTFAPNNAGTRIEKNPPEASNRIKGLSGTKRIALLSMEGNGMIGAPGYSSRLFDVLARNNIDIILITQASSVHTMLIAIAEEDGQKAKEVADEVFAYEISQKTVEPLKVETGYAIISLVGNDMANQSGTAARMFEATGGRGINIRAIANGSSEKTYPRW
ncbi:aspartate kinase, partial [Bacteroidales bacterium OttesenSCG-928-C03]|nr:aspartate kinase [Bacteroidales bacterium OttesenSCG-928-C03]